MNNKKSGLTIVACFNNDLKEHIKEQIIDPLNSTNYNFFPFDNLHCTFLTLFEVGNLIYNPEIEDVIISFVKKFFTENNLLGRINFTLSFDCIRLAHQRY